MEIIEKKISELNKADYNPRKISEKEKKKLKDSLEKFGYQDPIIWNKKTGNIIGGHMRYDILLETMGKDAKIKVVQVDLDEFQEKAFNLALNKISGDWDQDALSKLLDDLKENSKEMLKFTGFDESEVEKFVRILNKNQGEDNFNLPKEPKYKIQTGDIYQLGNHRLMCGDSTNEQMVTQLMNKQLADMVFTDPPYGVDYSEKNKFLNAISRGNSIQTPIENDNIEDYIKFFTGFLQNLQLKEENSIYLTISDQKLLELLQSARNSDIKMSQLLVWVKNNHVLGRQDYSNKHEMIFYGWKGKHKFYGQFDTTVWNFDKPLSSSLHPTMKPIELIKKALINSSQEEMIVYDAFGGSGSTLIACEQTNRKCYMMEIEPYYCSVILERWETLTNKKAVKIN